MNAGGIIGTCLLLLSGQFRDSSETASGNLRTHVECVTDLSPIFYECVYTNTLSTLEHDMKKDNKNCERLSDGYFVKRK